MPLIVNELRKRRQAKNAEKAQTNPAGPAEPSAEASLDWDHLRQLSLRPGGFREQRVELWKQLLNVEPQPLEQPDADKTLAGATKKVTFASSEPHRDERQIQLDTDRSFVLYPVEDMNERKRKQEELHELIVGVFRKRRTLHYYQGYHDVMSVLYLTLPPELQLPVAEKLSLHRLRDAMGPGLEPLMGQLCLLQRVLRQADPEYAALLEGAGPVPIYALSNLLTLFSHDMPTLPLIQHVFDYLLARPPIATVYLAAAVLLVRKNEAQRLEEVGEEGMLHSILNSLPDIYDEDCEDAVEDAASDAPHAASDEPSAENPVEKISRLAEERHTEAPDAHEAASGSAEPAEIAGSLPDVPDPIDAPASPLARSEADESVLSHPDDSTLVDDSRSPSEADTSVPEVPEEDHTLVSDVSEKKSGHAHDPSIETAGSFHTAPEGEVLSGTEPTITVDDASAVSPVEAEDSIRRPRVHLSTLLTCADTLFAQFPPMDASVDLPSVMGPQSVMLTWSEDPTRLPRDDDAEKMVLQPHLVVHRLPREFGGKEEAEAEPEQDRKRMRRKLHKRRRLRPSAPTVVTAMIALGVAVAVYHAQVAPERQHAHMREMKKLGKLAGGAVLGFGGRLWDGLVAMAG